MIQSIERATIVEGLLNSLETERYVRGALLLEVIDELATSSLFADACAQARRLLASVEQREIDDAQFTRKVAELRQAVQLAAPPPQSTERLTPTADLRRAELRFRAASAA